MDIGTKYGKTESRGKKIGFDTLFIERHQCQERGKIKTYVPRASMGK